MTRHPLEQHLGDPADPATPVSFARSVELDEAEHYPEAQAAALDAWGVHRHYVPAALGGELTSFEQLSTVVRLVARRNLSLAVSHTKTLYGALPVWVGGSPAQQASAAALVASGAQAALAYHEQEHGSDLFAMETTATKRGDRLVVDGRKWLVNNATRARGLALFARTDPRGGPRGFSVLWLDKDALDPATLTYLPRLRPLGIRGADFSGITFTRCEVAADSILGAPGTGVELSARAFQVTRALMPSVSLGAADTALRLTLEFATQRALYGTTVDALPYPRRVLVHAFADLLACDALVRTAVRAVHLAPSALRLWSSVAKAFVPRRVDGILYELGGVLGARSYLREGHAAGMFQKLVRDHAVVRVFHAGEFLLLQTVGQYLRYLASQRTLGKLDPDARPLTLTTSDAPLPAFAPTRLDLGFHDAGDVVRACATLHDLRTRAGTGTPALAAAAHLIDDLASAGHATLAHLDELARTLGRDLASSPELFDVSRRYAALEAAACTLATWLAHTSTPELAGGDWALIAAARCLAAAGIDATSRVPRTAYDATWELLLQLFRERRAFSTSLDHLA